MNLKKGSDTDSTTIYIRKGIETAQEISQNKGFAIGDLAGFKDDLRGLAWKIKQFKGDYGITLSP